MHKMRSLFAVQILPIFGHFTANVTLVGQEWLKLGVLLFCRKKKVFSNYF